MDKTPRGNRLHIAIFGRRNAGKSSLINALTRQEIALVSDVPGTTTDPVYKSMEILPLGPVVLIDTAGIDDIGTLGELRVKRTLSVLSKTDLALLVVAPTEVDLREDSDLSFEKDIIQKVRERGIPVLGVANKADLGEVDVSLLKERLGIEFVSVSTKTRQGIEQLKQRMIQVAPHDWESPTIVGDIISPGDIAVLVVPIDLAAPKGRLILPQVQTIRDILDHDACAMVVKERELKDTLHSLARKPKIVITDSQAFLKVDADTPPDIMLTSFSILFARYKGDLASLVEGVKTIEHLKPGDRVLIAEACTHHQVADDIGTVKIPRWLRQVVGGELDFSWAHGTAFPENLSDYKLIIHCGGCMINRREMLARIAEAHASGVPITNYGVTIAYLHGILERALSPFPLVRMALEEG